MFRVIIAGSRDFEDYELLRNKMDFLLSNIKETVLIISGMARGADRLGLRYAREREYEVMEFYANWDYHGKQAGYIRNVEMAEHADALVAFWDGKSRGTGHMINIAREKGLRVRVIRYDQIRK